MFGGRPFCVSLLKLGLLLLMPITIIQSPFLDQKIELLYWWNWDLYCRSKSLESRSFHSFNSIQYSFKTSIEIVKTEKNTFRYPLAGQNSICPEYGSCRVYKTFSRNIYKGIHKTFSIETYYSTCKLDTFNTEQNGQRWFLTEWP